jgi:hypothetical protein
MDRALIAGQITEFVNKIPVIDAHEHIFPQRDVRGAKVHLFELMSNGVMEYGEYIVLDLISAGMPIPRWEEDLTPKDSWNRIKSYIKRIRGTSYYRAFLAALTDLLNLSYEEITEANWRKFSDCLRKANQREDWYDYVLKNRGRVETALLDSWWDVATFEEVDRRFFTPVLRIDPFLKYEFKKGGLIASDKNRPENIATRWGYELTDFRSYLGLIDLTFEKACNAGVVGIKCAVAYDRILDFEKISEDRAAGVYNSGDKVGSVEKKAFGDFITHYCIQKATEAGLPVQIHTGMQAGNKSFVPDSNPLYLNKLLQEYTDTKFILLHGGFPFINEAGALAKIFSNVYLDFSWLPMISKEIARSALSQWIDLIPANKLLWGGDCGRVETAYGALLFAKEIVADVLAAKVCEGYFDIDLAFYLANAIFNENAKTIFKIS